MRVFFHLKKKKTGRPFLCVLGWVFGRVEEVDMEVWHYLFGFCLLVRQGRNKETWDPAASGDQQHLETLVDGFVIVWLLNLKNQPPYKLALASLLLRDRSRSFLRYHVFQKMLFPFKGRHQVHRIRGISLKERTRCSL